MRVGRAKKPSLPTPAEARLLKALWSLKEATVDQIVNYFPPEQQPNYKTTHTFLRIMEGKGFVRHTAAGKAFVFTPAIDEDEVARASVHTLLNQNFGGSVSGLFVNLLESGALQGNELLEIESLIQHYRKKKSEGKGQ